MFHPKIFSISFKKYPQRFKRFSSRRHWVCIHYTVKILLGRDNNHKECFAYYVPIKDSLRVLLSQNQLLEKAQSVAPMESNINMLQDLEDGYVVKSISSNSSFT